MRSPIVNAAGERSLNSIHIGGIFASDKPAIVRTVLGSCISVCLRDPRMEVGGINHFMLPSSGGVGSGDISGDDRGDRYGIHAMELLINACMKLGADRRRLEAKVFGGGHVLRMRELDGNVPQSNIRFALEFLDTENIPIISRDIGGYSAREIYFFTDSGRTMLKRLSNSRMPTLDDIARSEKQEMSRWRGSQEPAAPVDDSNITLF